PTQQKPIHSAAGPSVPYARTLNLAKLLRKRRLHCGSGDELEASIAPRPRPTTSPSSQVGTNGSPAWLDSSRWPPPPWPSAPIRSPSAPDESSLSVEKRWKKLFGCKFSAHVYVCQPQQRTPDGGGPVLAGSALSRA
ncbi:hypothetical protein EJB05_29138, partial [Eragrostis curvula]